MTKDKKYPDRDFRDYTTLDPRSSKKSLSHDLNTRKLRYFSSEASDIDGEDSGISGVFYKFNNQNNCLNKRMTMFARKKYNSFDYDYEDAGEESYAWFRDLMDE